MAWPAPVPPDFSFLDQTRLEVLDVTTPKDLDGSNFLGNVRSVGERKRER